MKTFSRMFRLVSLILLCSFIGSCKTIKLPNCPEISNPRSSEQNGISDNLAKICDQKNISIIRLSDVIIEFKGKKKDIDWLVSNYRFILCDFNQKIEPLDEKTYNSCLQFSKYWIKRALNDEYHLIMEDSNNYCAICCEKS